MKLYFHRAMLYVMARVWPDLFLRFLDDYWKRYCKTFLKEVKDEQIKDEKDNSK